MSDLELAMGMIIDVFGRYAGIEGSARTLTKREMKILLEKELPNFLSGDKKGDTVDKLMKELDENGDCEVDFNEFIIFVAALTSACHHYFTK